MAKREHVSRLGVHAPTDEPEESEMRMFPKSEPISKTIVAVALLMMIGIPAGMLMVFAIRLVGAMLG